MTIVRFEWWLSECGLSECAGDTPDLTHGCWWPCRRVATDVTIVHSGWDNQARDLILRDGVSGQWIKFTRVRQIDCERVETYGDCAVDGDTGWISRLMRERG